MVTEWLSQVVHRQREAGTAAADEEGDRCPALVLIKILNDRQAYYNNIQTGSHGVDTAANNR